MSVKKQYSKATASVFTLAHHSRIFLHQIRECCLVLQPRDFLFCEHGGVLDTNAKVLVPLSRLLLETNELEKKHDYIQKPLPCH